MLELGLKGFDGQVIRAPRREADLRGADLRWSKLNGTNLSSANLSGTNLSSANLSGADLYRANLSGAILTVADLTGARMNEVDLTKAYLTRTNLTGAALVKADLSGAKLIQVRLGGANLSGAVLFEVDLTEANLTGPDLTGADLTGVDLRDAIGLSQSRLDMALQKRQPESVIHHSDQGSQYTSIAFGQRCQQAAVRPSMGSVGDCFDNAMCESFFATLECELIDRSTFRTQIEARMAVFEFIEGFYNPRRRHSALDYLSPVNYERRHHELAKHPN